MFRRNAFPLHAEKPTGCCRVAYPACPNITKHGLLGLNVSVHALAEQDSRLLIGELPLLALDIILQSKNAGTGYQVLY
jgi:hypothetical protein